MTKNTKEQTHFLGQDDQEPNLDTQIAIPPRGLPEAGLVVVATPIGNLGDLSPRAQEALARANVIACEDTRRTGALCHKLGIETKRVVVHDHNERDQIAPILARIDDGELVALVSDAGTPGISDPGHNLINAVIDAGHVVTAVPGPVAAIMALTLSGLPTDRFTFEGFLPRKAGQRQDRLLSLAQEPRTMVFYMAPHRTGEELAAMVDAFGPERPACLARELTKVFESFLRQPLGDIAERYRDTPPKGEVVVVVGGYNPTPASELSDEVLIGMVDELVAQGMRKKAAAKQVATSTGRSANAIYDLTLRTSS